MRDFRAVGDHFHASAGSSPDLCEHHGFAAASIVDCNQQIRDELHLGARAKRADVIMGARKAVQTVR